jgi:transposase
MPIIAPIPRTERRLMQKTIHKTRDKNHARRLTAMLMLHRGSRVTDVARTLCCARSSAGRWINWFTLHGAEGLISLRPGRERRWPFEQICALLVLLVSRSPGDFGYQRSRWSTELLAIKINEITGCKLHPGTVRRWLPSAGLVWRRAAPTLHIRDPHCWHKNITGESSFLLPTENHVLWAWSSVGFGSALLSLDLNLRELAETSF